MRPEILISSEVAYNGGYLKVNKDKVVTPDGKEAWREVVKHRGCVAVVSIDVNGDFWFVHQWRHAVGAFCIELVAGVLDVVNEHPLECAKRELAEECGLESSDWTKLGELYSSPGYTSEICHLFMAKNATQLPNGKPPADDFVEEIKLSKEKLMEWIDAGIIRDSKTIAAIHMSLNRV